MTTRSELPRVRPASMINFLAASFISSRPNLNTYDLDRFILLRLSERLVPQDHRFSIFLNNDC